MHSIKLYYRHTNSNETKEVLSFCETHFVASDKIRAKHSKSPFACTTRLERQGENGLYIGYFMPIMIISMRGGGETLETAIGDYIEIIKTMPIETIEAMPDHVSKFFDGGLVNRALKKFGKKTKQNLFSTFKKVVDI